MHEITPKIYREASNKSDAEIYGPQDDENEHGCRLGYSSV